MTFLPFVLSFLLLLVIGSSILFTSLRSTLLPQSMILARHTNMLRLISEQAKRDFKKTDIKKVGPSKKKEEKEQEEGTREPFVNWRKQRNQFEDSKFNLWRLTADDHSPTAKLLYEKAIKLIENLYGETDFYKAENNPLLAKQIVDALCGKGGTALYDLFPEDEKLACVYYKMVKGTNTGYPALGEYFKIEPGSSKIQFRYASTEVLRAIFGDEFTHKILATERAKWEENPKTKVLTKDELYNLIKTHSCPVFDGNRIEEIFSFSLKKDGTPHAYVASDAKVMAQK